MSKKPQKTQTKIIALLSNWKSISASVMAIQLGLSRATIMRHCRILHKAGILKRFIYYPEVGRKQVSYGIRNR